MFNICKWHNISGGAKWYINFLINRFTVHFFKEHIDFKVYLLPKKNQRQVITMKVSRLLLPPSTTVIVMLNTNGEDLSPLVMFQIILIY
jgi:hypothetical protein